MDQAKEDYADFCIIFVRYANRPVPMNLGLPHVTAIGVALIGAVLFYFLKIPLPFLLGPIMACLVAALLRVPMKGIKPVNETMRTILGVAVGSTITPALLISMGAMWPTLLMMPVVVLLIGLFGVPYFMRICGYDFPTAYYSAMPGGLQDMLVFGEEAGGNVRAMSLIHATRVLVIVVALPFLLAFFWETDLTNPPGVPASTLPISQLAIMGVCAIAGWKIAQRVGMFGASILGPLILAAIASLSGIVQSRPPAEAIWIAQFFIGLTVGVKYVGITAKEIRHDIAAGFGFCIILILLTLGVCELIHALQLAPPLDSILAFAPGGQAELTVLALIAGADMAFVIAHHVLRIFIVILGAPIFAAWMRKHG